MNLMLCVPDFGGAKLAKRGKYTGNVRAFKHSQRKRVGWASEILELC